MTSFLPFTRLKTLLVASAMALSLQPLTQAAEARGAGCHVGVLGAAPDSRAMTRTARHVFWCAPTIVDTHAHLPHE